MANASTSRGQASQLEQTRLRLRPNADVTRIHRVRQYQNGPFMVEDVSLPDTLFPGLADHKEIPHRVALLAQRFGILLGRAEEQVRITLADDQTAQELAVAKKTPVLQLDRVVYTLDGRPVEWRLAKCNFGDEVYWTEMA